MSESGDKLEELSQDRSQRRAEAFLYREARLLDERRFEEWASLFAEDGRYWLPMGHEEPNPSHDVSLVCDDRQRLDLRIERLRGQHAFAQDPPSQTCRSVANVEVKHWGEDGDSRVTLRCVSTIVTLRRGGQELFIGRSTYKLRGRDPSEWMIVEKRVDLLTRNSTIDNLTFLV